MNHHAATDPLGRDAARIKMPQGRVSLILNMVSGWVDAVGYLALLASIQMFPSFMSGNLTKIVTDAVSGSPMRSVMIGGAVLSFFAGAVVARLVNGGRARRDPASLGLVSAVLGISGLNLLLGGFEYVTLLAMAAAMGMINNAYSGRMQFHVHTFLSGIWVALATAVADRIAGRAGWEAAVVPGVTMLSVLTGALAGALSVTYAPLSVSILMPTAVIGVIALALLAGLIPVEDPDDETRGAGRATRTRPFS